MSPQALARGGGEKDPVLLLYFEPLDAVFEGGGAEPLAPCIFTGKEELREGRGDQLPSSAVR